MGLVLATLLSAGASACAPEQTGPGPNGGVLGPPDPPAHGGGTGSNALVGDWTLVTIIPIGGDFQTSTVTWHFAADLTCSQARTTLLVTEGIPRTTVRDCTYLPVVSGVTVTFAGSAPATFSVAFAAFSADRLVLDGIEYMRAG